MPGLGDVRGQFSTELQNPAVYNKLIASVMAEVGSNNPTRSLGYIESVMNRAAARNKTLDQTISDKNYYPATTTSKLNKAYGDDTVGALHPLITQALGGSNISNYATGNESDKVYSANAPHTLITGPKPSDERFVLEKPDLAWGQRSGAQIINYPTGSIVAPDPSQTVPAAPAQLAATGVQPTMDPATLAKIQEMNTLIALTKQNQSY